VLVLAGEGGAITMHSLCIAVEYYSRYCASEPAHSRVSALKSCAASPFWGLVNKRVAADPLGRLGAALEQKIGVKQR